MAGALTDLIFMDTAELDAKTESAKDAIRRLWVESDDPAPWGLGWSGGKDSTAVLKLVVETVTALPPEQRNKRFLHVLSSDTGMENPLIEAYLHGQVEAFNAWAASQDYRMQATVVKRPRKHDFFLLVIGKGYTLPGSGYNRWCTHKYKIIPQDKLYAELQPCVVVTGMRKGESTRRDNTFDRYKSDDYYLQNSASFYKMLTPIIDFTVEDVWATLMYPLPWGDTEAVKSLYKDATGECGFRNPQGADDPVKACGARFGCWTCPVVGSDKSTEKMSETYRWLEPLTAWRQELKRVFGEYVPPTEPGQSRADRKVVLEANRQEMAETRKRNRSGYRRRGKHTGRDDGGILRVHARKELLVSLLACQDEVNHLRSKDGLEPLRLVSDEALADIHAIWAEDEAERPWLL